MATVQATTSPRTELDLTITRVPTGYRVSGVRDVVVFFDTGGQSWHLIVHGPLPPLQHDEIVGFPDEASALEAGRAWADDSYGLADA